MGRRRVPHSPPIGDFRYQSSELPLEPKMLEPHFRSGAATVPSQRGVKVQHALGDWPGEVRQCI